MHQTSCKIWVAKCELRIPKVIKWFGLEMERKPWPWIFYSLVEIKNVIIFRSQCSQNCFVLSAFIFLSATWKRNSINWNYCLPWFTSKNRGSAFWTMKWIVDMFDLSVEDCLLFTRVSLLLRSLRHNVILWDASIDWINTCFNPS